MLLLLYLLCYYILLFFGSAHSPSDICGLTCYMETKTMLVHNTISEVNLEHNILPIIFYMLTKNAQIRQ